MKNLIWFVGFLVIIFGNSVYAQLTPIELKEGSSYMIFDGVKVSLDENYNSPSRWDLHEIDFSSDGVHFSKKNINMYSLNLDLFTNMYGNILKNEHTYSPWWHPDLFPVYTGENPGFLLSITDAEYVDNNLKYMRFWYAVEGQGSVRVQEAYQIIGDKRISGRLLTFENLQLKFVDKDVSLDDSTYVSPVFPNKSLSGRLFILDESKPIFPNTPIPKNRYFITLVSRETYNKNKVSDINFMFPVIKPVKFLVKIPVKIPVGKILNPVIPGHTFIQWIIVTPKQTQVKANGFYTKYDKDEFTAIYGNVLGSIKDEYRKEQSSFNKSWTANFRFEISEADYSRSIKALNDWKKSADKEAVRYNYTASNCVLVTSIILKSLTDTQLTLPLETDWTRPRIFVETVKEANKDKNLSLDEIYKNL